MSARSRWSLATSRWNQGIVNSLYFTELCDADVPVHAGAARPLLRQSMSPRTGSTAPMAWAIGATVTSRSALNRATFTPSTPSSIAARSTPGLVIVTLGPLTNLALALRKAPDIVPRVSRCVVMGGAACTNGNVTPAAEYNIWCDPEAARIVFRSGLPVEMVGWEFSTGDFVLSLDDIDYVRGIGTPYADFTVDCNIKGMRGYEIQTGEIGISLPDGVAMAVAIDPTICTPIAAGTMSMSNAPVSSPVE